jgi:hypothetical protein
MKTKITFLIVTLGLSIPSIAITQAGSLPKAKITVIVRNENGELVQGALVGVGGTMGARPGEAVNGSTSADGSFTAEVPSNGEVGITARKDGYYDTLGPDYNFRNAPRAIERAFLKDQWEPWNPTVEVTLKRILHPIPMYARSVETKFPLEATPVGFDLEVGEWVEPYGHGKSSDFVFKVHRTINNDRDYSVISSLSFSNKNDGIIGFRAPAHDGSLLKSPHTALERGYESEKAWTYVRSPTKAGHADALVGGDVKDQNYLFRIRSVLDKDGRIQSALYGKIYGDIRLYVGTRAAKPGIGFTYYLNPTPNDRNVEFDPKRNLFTNLKDDERVTAP